MVFETNRAVGRGWFYSRFTFWEQARDGGMLFFLYEPGRGAKNGGAFYKTINDLYGITPSSK